MASSAISTAEQQLQKQKKNSHNGRNHNPTSSSATASNNNNSQNSHNNHNHNPTSSSATTTTTSSSSTTTRATSTITSTTNMTISTLVRSQGKFETENHNKFHPKKQKNKINSEPQSNCGNMFGLIMIPCVLATARGRLFFCFQCLALPKTISSHLKMGGPLEKGDSYWKPPFLGAMLVLIPRSDSQTSFWCSSCVCVCVLMVSVLSFGREFLEFARLGVATNWFGLGHSWIDFPSWTFIGCPCQRNHLHFPFPSAPPLDFGHISLHNRSYFWSSFWPSPWSSQGLFAWLIGLWWRTWEVFERRLEDLLRDLQHLTVRAEGALDSGAAETRSGAWDVVTTPRPVGRGSPPSSSHEYNSLAREIPPIPDFCVRLCANLSGRTRVEQGEQEPREPGKLGTGQINFWDWSLLKKPLMSFFATWGCSTITRMPRPTEWSLSTGAKFCRGCLAWSL